MSYATGQDVRIYFHYVDRFIESGFSAASIAACARTVVPGYPLLLAVGKLLVGYFAVYWINIPLFILCALLLAGLFKKQFRFSEIGLMLMLFLGLVLTGYDLNPHFLLLPFRGVVEWFFMFAVLACAVSALDTTHSPRRRSWMALGTGILLLVGAAFRETVVFILAPVSLCAVWQGCRRDKTAWRVLGLMWLPVVCGGLVVVLGRLFSGERIMNKQVRLWLRYARDPDGLNWLPDILKTLYTELRPAGVLLLAAGLYTGWRRRAKGILILFLLACMLILFYAQYKTLHLRYVLSIAGLLAVIAGLGLGAVCSGAMKYLAPRFAKGLWLAVWAGLAVWISISVSKMESWGPKITQHDIQSLQAHPLSRTESILMEANYRFLTDVLLNFTDVRPVDLLVTRRLDKPMDLDGVYLLRTDDETGYFPMNRWITQEQWARHFYDLHPTDGTLTVGGVDFDVYQVRDWQPGTHTQSIPPPPASHGGVLWLDFHAGIENGRVQVELMPPSGDAIHVPLDAPKGFIPIAVGGAAGESETEEKPGEWRLSITSEQPIPSDIAAAWTDFGATRWFSMEIERTPSVLVWPGDDFLEQHPAAKHGAPVIGYGDLHLPLVQGPAANGMYTVRLRLTVYPAAKQDIIGTFGPSWLPEGVPWTLRKGRATKQVDWSGPVRADSSGTWDLHITEGLPEGQYLRVEAIGFSYNPPD